MSTESTEKGSAAAGGGSAPPKYFLNSLDSLIRDGLVGLAVADPRVRLLAGVDAIVRADVRQLRDQGRALIVSGGGAGHEPMFTGFVGPAALTAAISGQYFASPSAGQIARLVEAISGGRRSCPVVLVLANYTGDRLNFGLAKEALTLAGYADVRMVVFGDDLTPYLRTTNGEEEEGCENTKEIAAAESIQQSRRRGLAGIAFVHRIAGAMSEEGATAASIERRLNSLSSLVYTLSISLSAVDIPGVGASFSLPTDQMELGLGVHGESGIERMGVKPASETVALMLERMLAFLNGKGFLEKEPKKTRVALIVNNLGGLTPIESHLVVGEVVRQLSAAGVTVERLIAGQVMTSGNMKGVSISVLLLVEDEDKSGDELLRLLDRSLARDRDSRAAPGAVNVGDYIFREEEFSAVSASSKTKTFSAEAEVSEEDGSHPAAFGCSPALFRSLLTGACEQIIKQEQHLNELDGSVGDSDCGSTLAAMARLFQLQLQRGSPSLATLATVVGDTIGGTSGAVYGLLLTTAAGYIRAHPATFDLNVSEVSFGQRTAAWLALLRHTMDRISVYSGARRGDRSMLDALHGVELGLERAVEASVDEMQTLSRHLVDCTWTQARKTAEMKAAVGRAAYVNQSYLTQPDAGAVGVAVWVEAIARVLSTSSEQQQQKQQQQQPK